MDPVAVFFKFHKKSFLYGLHCVRSILSTPRADNLIIKPSYLVNTTQIEIRKHSTPCPIAFYFENWKLAHICVEESNVLRLEIRTQTWEQSSLVFLRRQSWVHFYLIYSLMISLTLLLMLVWGYMLMIQHNTYQTAIQMLYSSLHRVALMCFNHGLSVTT